VHTKKRFSNWGLCTILILVEKVIPVLLHINCVILLQTQLIKPIHIIFVLIFSVKIFQRQLIKLTSQHYSQFFSSKCEWLVNFESKVTGFRSHGYIYIYIYIHREIEIEIEREREREQSHDFHFISIETTKICYIP